MSRLSSLPSDIIEEIGSSCDSLSDQLNFALNIPNGDIFYDNLRKSPEYWINKLEKNFSLTIPSKYAQKVTVLERFYIVCEFAATEIHNTKIHSVVALTTMLPEIFKLIRLIYEGGKVNDKFLGSLLRMYIVIAFETNIFFLITLYEVTVATENDKYFKLLVNNVFLSIAHRLTSRAAVKKFENAIEISDRFMKDTTRDLFQKHFMYDSYQIPFVDYEVSVEIRKAFLRQDYEEVIIYYYKDHTIDDVFTPSLFKTEHFYPEISQYIVENFDIAWYNEFGTSTKSPSCNLLLLILLAANFRDREDILDGVICSEKTLDQYRELQGYFRAQYFDFDVVKTLTLKYPDNELLQQL